MGSPSPSGRERAGAQAATSRVRPIEILGRNLKASCAAPERQLVVSILDGRADRAAIPSSRDPNRRLPT
jgi:hypothetical protein